MTVCNMSIEGGARCGYVNPDETTVEYLARPAVRAAGRRVRPGRRVVAALASDAGRRASTTASSSTRADIEPTVTWGINPGQSVGVGEAIPRRRTSPTDERGRSPKRSSSWTSSGGQPIAGHEDRRRLHRLLHERPDLRPARSGRDRARAAGRPARARRSSSPARSRSAQAAEAEGLDEVFRAGRLRMARAPAARCAWR